ncbi:putative phenazine biosynthesis-like protein [Aspergillus steynii IBT 23096]|uniref:Putative phenazine biosynthesis-like protein n=1 Tax=Aspergillus steynii IBT 23096 TaxID=1392250 RepID=A0A2I2GCF0_9EURO|nr:putative phenazine biosynthesis-like protein [Aspergillus steynii IBT 23096]PLB50559.1 putative phenazine biosynthesis-like protein [Aspergillus steynii IBT 23096]
MGQRLRFITLDVFTSQPYAGNPLAVVFLPEPDNPASVPLTQSQKLSITREFNLSETIFVHAGGDEKRTIDIFTTACEIPFAGHPTIGAASWFLCHSPITQERERVRCLVTKAGEIPISLQQSLQEPGVVARIAHNVRFHAARYPLSELLRLHASLTPFFPAAAQDMLSFPVVSIVNGMSQVHVELPSLNALAAVTTSAGGEVISVHGQYLDEGWRSGHCVLYFYVRDVEDALLGTRVIRTRMILGNEEDAATGSAASGLVAYLSLTNERLGRHTYDIVQGVEMGRRSQIGIDITTSPEKVESLELKGAAVPVSEGTILIPGE